MKIIEMKIDELKAYENNPRFNGNAVEGVKNSIAEFGFKVPVVIDKNNVIVSGHTRVLAAKELEMEIIPCIVADDLTDEQIKAFRLADNRVSEKALWDYEKLEEELREIIGIDMTDFGFEELEEIDIDQFFEENNKKDEEKEPEIEEPEQIQCPHCQMWFTKE